MKLNKVFFICVFIKLGLCFNLKSQVLIVNKDFLNPNVIGTLDNALLTAMNSNNGSAVINLSVTTSVIKISYNLPVFVFPNNLNKSLTIQKHPTPSLPLPDQVLDMSFYNALPTATPCNVSPGFGTFCWDYPDGCLNFVNAGNRTANLTIDKVYFNNYNKLVSTLTANNYNYLVNNVPTFFGLGGPCPLMAILGLWSPYVSFSGLNSAEIKNCSLQNYIHGIQYNRTTNANIHDNMFVTDAKYGNCTSYGPADAIMYDDNLLTHNTIFSSSITSNTVTANPPGLFYPGSAVSINPYFKYGNLLYGTYNNVNTNLNFSIQNNKFSSSNNGIVCENLGIRISRTTPDLTYNINVSNNQLSNCDVNLMFGRPYKHFVMAGNSFSMTNLTNNPNTYYIPGLVGPYYFGNGSTHLILGASTFSPVGNALYSTVNPVANTMGFKMIGTGNTLGLPVFNNTNTFTYINDVVYSDEARLWTTGNFGSGVDFIKINHNGVLNTISGKNTNVRESTFKNFNGIASPNFYYAPPINHFPYLANELALPSIQTVPVNGGITAPVLKDARITPNNLLKIAFDLTGPAIIPANGPWVVEFFRSNIKGELTDFIGKQTINTLTGFTYSLTVIPQLNLTLTPGDRIGATLTSIANTPLGTSTVSYIYTTPCNDCISDFAPVPGKEYVFSCWTKSGFSQAPQVAYGGLGGCQVKFTFYSTLLPTPVQIGSPVIVSQTGPMVDTWQQISGNVSVPVNAKTMKMEFVNGEQGGTYVDDIRFFPKDATMKSYSYDPDNMRLMAELDERNYATFYEYDEEGKLIRVKKETEKGIMTIKESRNSKPTK